MVLSGTFHFLITFTDCHIRSAGERKSSEGEICGRKQMAVDGITREQGINLKSFLLYALTFHL